jgi:hypothetical protein
MKVLINRKPTWDPVNKIHELNFFGRARLASIKNFELIDPSEEKENIYILFGRYDKKTYSLDF